MRSFTLFVILSGFALYMFAYGYRTGKFVAYYRISMEHLK